jgi:membrane protein implicated in regulation of membrane protease activity
MLQSMTRSSGLAVLAVILVIAVTIAVLYGSLPVEALVVAVLSGVAVFLWRSRGAS